MMDKIRAVLFDLDDTLISRRETFAGFSESFVRRFFPAEDAAGQARAVAALRRLDREGDATRPDLFFHLFGELNVDLPPIGEMIDFWNTEFPKYLVLFDDMFRLLGELRRAGFRLGLVTNGAAPLQNGKIERGRLRPAFDTVVVSGEQPFDKPQREIFELALHRLAVAPDAAVYVGDNLINDIYGAQKAGMRAVWANFYHRGNPTAVRPDGEFDTADGLRRWIDDRA